MCVALAPLAMSACGASGADRFPQEAWAEADLSTRSRVPIADDLIASGLLSGKSRTEVMNLLGPPVSDDQSSEMVYLLGPTEYMPIDYELLVIELDEHDRVTAYRRRSS